MVHSSEMDWSWWEYVVRGDVCKTENVTKCSLGLIDMSPRSQYYLPLPWNQFKWTICLQLKVLPSSYDSKWSLWVSFPHTHTHTHTHIRFFTSIIVDDDHGTFYTHTYSHSILHITPTHTNTRAHNQPETEHVRAGPCSPQGVVISWPAVGPLRLPSLPQRSHTFHLNESASFDSQFESPAFGSVWVRKLIRGKL